MTYCALKRNQAGSTDHNAGDFCHRLRSMACYRELELGTVREV